MAGKKIFESGWHMPYIVYVPMPLYHARLLKLQIRDKSESLSGRKKIFETVITNSQASMLMIIS